uniref:ATP synthase subunit a n=1 Tax=Mesargus serrata TaxID=2901391 RepID=A0A8K2AU12_9HEMI|nr:ATP synthase F0 subunit 6 [Mesargus serrata]
MNLFSTFDPSTGNFSMNWISIMFLITILPYSMWITKSNMMMLMFKTLKMMNNEMKSLNFIKGYTIMSTSLFYMILMINIMGILPYIFTSSSHILMSLSMALPLWMSLMMYGWINKTNSMFMHLVPISTPALLMPMMVMIETTSNLIRPGSLAVRLSANMIAGHILMSLLGNNNQFFTMIVLMVMFTFLFVFESAVAFIQSYVFMTLSTLYSSEI